MPLKFAFRVALIAALNLIPVALPLADATGAVKGSIPTASATTDTPDIVTHAAPNVGVPALELMSHADAEAELKRLQGAQDHIKQQASTATSFKQLSELDDATKQLGEDTDKLIAALLPQRAQLQAQLGVLGPPPVAGATPEAPAVAEQRTDLDTRKAQLDAELKQASDSKANLVNLTGQIARLGHGLMKNQLAFRSGSIFGAQFWAPLFQPNPDDQERLRAFGEEVSPVLKAVWQPGQKAVTVLLLVLALVVWIVGRQLAERGMAYLCLHRLPEGRLRRSAFALSTTLATVFATAIAVQLVYYALTRHAELPPSLDELAEALAKLAMTSALIVGLGRALLCTRHPTWRLPAIADPVALSMKPFVSSLAGLLLLSGALEQLNRTVDTSLQVTLFGRGIVSLVVVLTIGLSLVRSNRVRSTLAAAGEPPEARSTLAGLIHAGVTLTVVVSFGALLIGYISIARFLTYELVWFDIVLCSLYLLTQITKDACESFFSAHHASGQAIKHLFGLGDMHLDQVSTILSGVGTSLLVLIAVFALFTGGFGTTPSDLLNSLLNAFGAERLHRLNIVPSHILNAAIALVVGVYLLRSVRRWLDAELLPKSGMDPGMRMSLVTLFSNLGYVVLVLLILSLLGVKWSNLAWIVSALSVGIGFGLQEIVKNFVSGLILLTERPVKVGDMISISGVEGDIRRINVRATEIQLSDRSTVIVPNSQLISQNLRNVTMGNSTQGVATLMLTFPLNTDPEQIRDILLSAYQENPAILDKPTPSVTFSQLTPDGITLSVTGYVSSPRISGSTKSELLFEILKRLRVAEITLSTPQMMMIQNVPHPGA
jgi:potassium-dependent mechanosensitive channel